MTEPWAHGLRQPRAAHWRRDPPRRLLRAGSGRARAAAAAAARARARRRLRRGQDRPQPARGRRDMDLGRRARPGRRGRGAPDATTRCGSARSRPSSTRSTGRSTRSCSTTCSSISSTRGSCCGGCTPSPRRARGCTSRSRTRGTGRSCATSLLRGTFGYTAAEHRDVTHLRWFTRSDLVELLESTGWAVDGVDFGALRPVSRAGGAAHAGI